MFNKILLIIIKKSRIVTYITILTSEEDTEQGKEKINPLKS